MYRIRTILLVFIIMIACFVTETGILPSIAVMDIMPNLMIILTASYGFMFGDRVGIFIGFACGLLCDIYFGPLIGFQAAVYALIGYLCGKFQRILYVEDLAFPLFLIAASDILYGFLTYVFLFLIQNRLFIRSFFLQCVFPETVYTVAAAVVVYPVLRFLYNRFMRPQRSNGTDRASGKTPADSSGVRKEE